jgi:hypothetical protein
MMMSCTGNSDDEEELKEEPQKQTMVMSCTDNDEEDVKQEPRKERIQPSTMMIPDRAKDSELPEQTMISGEVQKQKLSRATMESDKEREAAADIEDNDDRFLHIIM